MLKRLWTYFSIVFGGMIIAAGFNLFLIPIICSAAEYPAWPS